MYKIANNTACISGIHGRYDGQIKNPSVRYGRNAIDNYREYAKDLRWDLIEFPDMKNLSKLEKDDFEERIKELESAIDRLNKQRMLPNDFTCRYSPHAKINTQSLMGAAYEELNKRTSISTQEMTQKLQQTTDELMGEPSYVVMSAEALDMNADGEIDLGEYATNILLSDALSKDSTNFDAKNINRSFTNKGEDATLPYAIKSYYKIASATYKGLYELYRLDDAKNKFISDAHNLI